MPLPAKQVVTARTGDKSCRLTVKQVTTNNVTADQAIIADSVTTGGASASLLAASSEGPMPILSETGAPDLLGVGGGTKSK
jgi:hypothetical protein